MGRSPSWLEGRRRCYGSGSVALVVYGGRMGPVAITAVAVAVILTLAIAAPMTSSWLASRAQRRFDAEEHARRERWKHPN